MSTTSPPTSVAVLDRAVTWTHGCLERARRTPLEVPTPCASWRLGDLLLHMEDSLAALGDAAGLGRVALAPVALPLTSDGLVDRLVDRACRTREAWARRVTSAPVGVGDLVLGRDTLALVGALEIAVHGWDVACATGDPAPVPDDLASALLATAYAVVTPAERRRRFAAPVAVPPSAPAGTLLLAHLGRRADLVPPADAVRRT